MVVEGDVPSEFWEEFSQDGEDLDDNEIPGWVPPLGGIGGIVAMMGQPVNLDGLFAWEGRRGGDLERQHLEGDNPWGGGIGGDGDDGDDDEGDEEGAQDSDDNLWVPPIAGAHGWAPVPVALEDILGVDGFAGYDVYDMDGSEAEDWVVEEDGHIVNGSGVDYPWGGGDDDDSDNDEQEGEYSTTQGHGGEHQAS